jgi:hypothetical protein
MLSVEPVLLKAGYKPTTVRSESELAMAVRERAYDLVVVDGNDTQTVGRVLQGAALPHVVPGLSMQASYSYAVVPRVLDISHNRSNGAVEGDYFLTRHISARGLLSWQVTHGGLRFPADVQGFPDRILEFHRLLRDNYLQVGGGLSYFWHEWDVSASYAAAVSGSNSHTVRVISLSVGKRFGGG